MTRSSRSSRAQRETSALPFTYVSGIGLLAAAAVAAAKVAAVHELPGGGVVGGKCMSVHELPGGEGEACPAAGALGRLGFRLSLWAGGAPQTAGRVPGTPLRRLPPSVRGAKWPDP